MGHLRLADLRREWHHWLMLTAILGVASYGLASMTLALASGVADLAAPATGAYGGIAHAARPAGLFVLVALVSVAIVRGLSTLMVDCRRTSAELDLSGASGQAERRRLLRQTALLSLIATLIGTIIAEQTASTTRWLLDGQTSGAPPMAFGLVALVLMLITDLSLVGFTVWSVQRRARRPMTTTPLGDPAPTTATLTDDSARHGSRGP